MTAPVEIGVRDQLYAHIRFAAEIRQAAERATSLPDLHDAIRAALTELNAALNPEAGG